MTDTAHAALAPWGASAPTPVARRENAVFRVTLPDGAPGALRLHRAGLRSDAAIAAELDWCAALARAGLPVAAPVPTRAGHWLAPLPDGTRASVVAWIDAAPLDAARLTEDDAHALGRLIARLHAADAPLDATARPRWDSDGLLGAAPLWGRFWDNPALTPPEAALLRAARDAARAALAEQSDIGPVHGDLLADNVLRDANGGLHLIDFDDCGIGPRAYDLGTAAVGFSGRADAPALRAALLAGYADRRAVAPAGLALMVMLRAMASAGWVLSRTDPGDPRRRAYAARAVACARAWSDERAR